MNFNFKMNRSITYIKSLEELNPELYEQIRPYHSLRVKIDEKSYNITINKDALYIDRFYFQHLGDCKDDTNIFILSFRKDDTVLLLSGYELECYYSGYACDEPFLTKYYTLIDDRLVEYHYSESA